MKRLGTLLQIDDLTWSTITHQQLSGRIMTVLFAYGILAWNRFGLLSFTAPRAAVRLVLLGVYSWMALAALIWLASRFGPAVAQPRHAAIAAAIVHIPLVALGFFMAVVAGFAQILWPGFVLALVVSALWMPALLLRAFRDVAGLGVTRAIAAAGVVHIAWLVGPGRFFYGQVGHLL